MEKEKKVKAPESETGNQENEKPIHWRMTFPAKDGLTSAERIDLHAKEVKDALDSIESSLKGHPVLVLVDLRDLFEKVTSMLSQLENEIKGKFSMDARDFLWEAQDGETVISPEDKDNIREVMWQQIESKSLLPHRQRVVKLLKEAMHRLRQIEDDVAAFRRDIVPTQDELHPTHEYRMHGMGHFPGDNSICSSCGRRQF